MKLTKAALASFLLLAQASAWSSGVAARSGAFRVVSSRRSIAAIHLHSAATSSITTSVVGEEATESFRLQFQESGKTVSPWHDIAFKNSDGSYNMVSGQTTFRTTMTKEMRLSHPTYSSILLLGC